MVQILCGQKGVLDINIGRNLFPGEQLASHRDQVFTIVFREEQCGAHKSGGLASPQSGDANVISTYA